MDISVKLAAEAVAASGTENPEQDAVIEAARELGLTLRPMHPGIDDRELAAYFTAEAGSDWAAAEEAAARLNELDAVEGAYVSPAPEPAANGEEGP